MTESDVDFTPRRRARAGGPHPGRRPARDGEVIDAAARVFYERGYGHATVQDVADALGILKGSLYYYIDTKEDLLFRILSEVHDGVDVTLQRLMGQPLEPVTLLQEYVREQVKFNLRNLVKISVYHNDLNRLSDMRKSAILERRAPHEEFVVSLVEQAQRQTGGNGAGPDARLVSHCVFGTIIWPYRWFKPRGNTGIDEFADLCAQFVGRALRAPGPPQPAEAGPMIPRSA